jgi:hypothetical protein
VAQQHRDFSGCDVFGHSSGLGGGAGRGKTIELSAIASSCDFGQATLAPPRMEVVGNYHEDGYAHLKGLIPPQVAQAFLQD